MKNEIEIHMYIKSLSKIIDKLHEDVEQKELKIQRIEKRQQHLEYTLAFLIILIIIVIIGVYIW